MGLPAIYVPAGPMLRGNWRGRTLGSGSDVWKFWADRRAGVIGDQAWREIEDGIARSPGHCMTMGTASTMTSAAEALGMTLTGMASIPAVDSAHYRMAAATGRRIVEMAWADLTPDQILTREAFEDAVATVLALGGSTNAFIHLIAMAGRAGVDLTLDDFDAISRRVPWLANIRPSGTYLMEDFYYAGGLPALLGQLAKVPGALHLELTEAFDKQTQKFKSPAELALVLKNAGIDVARPTVTHCQSGGRSSVMAFTLELMGAKEVANYYRGWSEWGNAADTLIVTPKKK